MTTPQSNIIDKESTNLTGQDDSAKNVVRSFVELVDKYKLQQSRINKLSEITEDYKQLESLSDKLPDSTRPNMKASILHRFLGVFDSGANKVPKIKPVGTNESSLTLSIIDNVKDIVFADVGFDEVYKDIIQGFKTEGSVFIQLGFHNNRLTAEKCDLSEIYFDAEKELLARDSDRKGKAIKTIIRTVALSYGEFARLYPDYKDKVIYGDPAKILQTDTKNTTEKTTDDQKVVIHYAYTIDEVPRFTVYAGGSATLISDLKDEDYPFWRNTANGRKVAFLPFVDFHFTKNNRGFYSRSMVGEIKDAANAYEKILNISLPMFSKAVNPITLLFGSKSERTNEQLMIAQELQELGVPQIIPVGENVQMHSIKPESVFNDFEIARKVILRDLAMRVGVNFQSLEEVEQTATEFVGKTKTELTAVQSIYTKNETSFSRFAEYVIALVGKYWDAGDTREFKVLVDESAGSEVGLSISEVLDEIKDWRGCFSTETDLKMPQSTQDKVQAISEMETAIANVFYGRQFKTSEEIELEIDGLIKRAVLRDLDDVYTRAKLIKKAEIILTGGGEPSVQPPVDNPAPPKNPANEDIATELAPNSFLAEAGM